MNDDILVTFAPERWHSASEIFADALEHGERYTREAYLMQACGDDYALIRQMRALMMHMIARPSRCA